MKTVVCDECETPLRGPGHKDHVLYIESMRTRNPEGDEQRNDVEICSWECAERWFMRVVEAKSVNVPTVQGGH